MTNSNLQISSITNGTCVDGKGIRSIIFLSGCNSHCKFCQNIETLKQKGETFSVEEVYNRILRYTPYIKNGGITFSGGEPFLQAEALCELAEKLKQKGLSIAIETNGSIANERLISLANEIIVDKKEFPIDEFLQKCQNLDKNVVLTKVIIEGENDNEATAKSLFDLKQKYSCIKTIKLLPFVTLCKEKYISLGLDASFFERPSTSAETIKRLQNYISTL